MNKCVCLYKWMYASINGFMLLSASEELGKDLSLEARSPSLFKFSFICVLKLLGSVTVQAFLILGKCEKGPTPNPSLVQ